MENVQEFQVKQRGEFKRSKTILPIERWTRLEDDLWLGPHGVIVNQAALEERRFYYTIITESN